MDHYADDLAAVTAHLDLQNAVHVGHSTGGGEVAHYIARHGESRVAKAVLISAVPPLMVKTDANPGGLPKEVFDGLQAAGRRPTARGSTATSRPARSTATTAPALQPSEAIIDNWWRQGMMGGAKAHYDGIVAFSQTDFTEDLKKITVPVLVMHGDDDQIVPYADSGPLSAKLVKNGTLKTYHGFPHGMPTTQADDDQRRPAGLAAILSSEATMTEPTPYIDYANLPNPTEGFLATLFITVRKVAKSRDFYSRVLGGTVVLEENPCMVKLSNSWIIMNPGGPPTPDKPGITVADYEPGNTTSIFLNLRVADIQACYEEWKAKGAEFVTPPIDRGAETRCYMRDPDGYLIEVGQSTGLLHGHLAAKRPEDLPG